jgi:hypothetical protein
LLELEMRARWSGFCRQTPSQLARW